MADRMADRMAVRTEGHSVDQMGVPTVGRMVGRMEVQTVDRLVGQMAVQTVDRSVGQMAVQTVDRSVDLKVAQKEGLMEVHLVDLQDLLEVRVALHRFVQLTLVRIQALLQVLRELGLVVVSV